MRSTSLTILSVKADSHLMQGSVFSAVDCVNAEIGNFLSPFGNATICHRSMQKMH